jgi:hypothetical protein
MTCQPSEFDWPLTTIAAGPAKVQLIANVRSRAETKYPMQVDTPNFLLNVLIKIV